MSMLETAFKPIGLDLVRLMDLIKAHDLDGIFFSSPENVFYTTGYPCLPGSGNPIIYALRNQLPFFSYAGRDGSISLLCWAQAAMGIEYGTEDVRSFFTYDSAISELTSFVEEKLKEGCKLGVDSTFPYFFLQTLLEHAKPESIVAADDIIQSLQMVKSAAEIERIRMSTAIIDKTVMEIADDLRLGMSRLELIQEAKARLYSNGANGVDHVTVAFGAANPEIALDEPLEENQIVTLDLGAVYEGYISDNRRLVYTGKVPETLQGLHKKLCWVVAEMGKALHPGVTFGELHAHAYELYENVDVEPMFLHVGHSIGLHVDEHWLMADDPTIVQKGMVLNIELYSLSDEAVMIGDEETFVVTDGVAEKLSTLPVDIIERKLN
ncbi:MAG: M24 family metallopeptidase [Anaerolineales bacterium]